MTRWFVRLRARAMSISSTGISVGGVVLTPLISRLVDIGGMRLATPMMAALVPVVSLPIIWFVLGLRSARDGAAPRRPPRRRAGAAAPRRPQRGVAAPCVAAHRGDAHGLVLGRERRVRARAARADRLRDPPDLVPRGPARVARHRRARALHDGVRQHRRAARRRDVRRRRRQALAHRGAVRGAGDGRAARAAHRERVAHLRARADLRLHDRQRLHDAVAAGRRDLRDGLVRRGVRHHRDVRAGRIRASGRSWWAGCTTAPAATSCRSRSRRPHLRGGGRGHVRAAGSAARDARGDARSNVAGS